MHASPDEDPSGRLFWHRASVSRADREAARGHRSALVWFTGLSGSGKSTIAHAVEAELHAMGCGTMVLDGDNVRQGLCSGLGFSDSDRVENIRRVGEVARLFVEAGVVTLTAFISPFRQDRERVRNLVGEADFIEVFCDCPIDVCESRDQKDLYRRARAGEIPDFTGISSPYEPPVAPALVLSTAVSLPDECVRQVLELLHSRRLFIRPMDSGHSQL